MKVNKNPVPSQGHVLKIRVSSAYCYSKEKGVAELHIF